MKIVLATHGNLGEGLLDSYEMISGKSEIIQIVKLTKSGIGDFKERLYTLLDELTQSEKVLVLCDLKGGTPYNESFMYSLEKPGKIEVVTGVNLPMLIEIGFLADSEKNAEKLAEIAMTVGKDSIEKLLSSDEDDELDL